VYFCHIYISEINQKRQIMIRLVTFLSLSFFIFNQTGFSQEPAESVFFANRGGDRQWLTYQDNHRALYRIITDEVPNVTLPVLNGFCSLFDRRMPNKIRTTPSPKVSTMPIICTSGRQNPH